jgi:U4/U6 small nuclear ribonucleoprotein PRP31
VLPCTIFVVLSLRFVLSLSLSQTIDARRESKTIAAAVPGEQHKEYDLIVQANTAVVELAEELFKVYRFVKDIYRKKFPDLETILVNPVEYIRVVQRIGNADDPEQVDLSDLLVSATMMVVSVQASTLARVSLSDDEMQRVLAGCRTVLQIDECRRKLLEFVESRMSIVAPNLTVLVGPTVAAKLMGSVGGLVNLSKLPSTTIQVLGNVKRNLSGFSTASVRQNMGFLWESEIVNRAPSQFRHRTVRQLAGK